MSRQQSTDAYRRAPAIAAPHAWPAAEVAHALGTGPSGITVDEATRRLERDGPNRLEDERETSAPTHLVDRLRRPLNVILVVAAVVTAVLGEYVDTGVIVAVLAINATIGLAQERSMHRSVQALRQLAAPKAVVLRAGERFEIAGAGLVVGDLVLLDTGDLIPADVRLAEATGLATDESVLTAESTPVPKTTTPVDRDSVVADRRCMAFMGSTVAGGRARGYVTATGADTERGKLSARIRRQPEPEAPFQKRKARFASIVAVAVAASSVAAIGIGLAVGRSAAEAFFTAVALAVAVVPAALPVVSTVALALGVSRIARRRAILRRLPAVETLDSTMTIGCQKTGTLTRNRMTVQELWACGHLARVDGSDPLDLGDHGHPLRLLVEAGILTNDADVWHASDGLGTRGDPTETALYTVAGRLGVDPVKLRAERPVVADQPFDPTLLYSTTVREEDGRAVQYLKGAPERVLAHCATMADVSPVDPDVVLAVTEDMAGRGLRVLGMARRVFEPFDPAGEVDTPDDPEWLDTPGGPEDVPDPDALEFLGLQALLDPLREQVPEAVTSLRKAGIQVLVITGDHPQTGRSIAAQSGLADEGSRVLTGAEVERMDQPELEKAVLEVPVFARVSPAHELRVVRALQANDRVTAITGDGVDDAPVLTAADIGIAMGERGTDVAREASDMVLPDDDFVSIRDAVRDGRVTFDNVRNVTFFLMATGAAAIVAILSSLLFGLPLPYVPAQLLWLNLVTNGLQGLALAVQPGGPDVLDRPPRRPGEGLVSPVLWARTAVTGAVMAAGSLTLFAWALREGHPLPYARTVALTTLVVFMAFHVFDARSERRSVFRLHPLSSRFALVAQASALFVHFSAMYIPALQTVLRIEPIAGIWWLRIAVLGLSVVIVSEIHKLLVTRRHGNG